MSNRGRGGRRRKAGARWVGARFLAIGRRAVVIEFRCRDHPTRLILSASRWVELEELADENIAYEPYSPVQVDRDGVNRVLAQCPTCGRINALREDDVVAELRRLTPGPEGRLVITHLV